MTIWLESSITKQGGGVKPVRGVVSLRSGVYHSGMQPKVTPKDFFLWLGAMVALYGSVISLITLLFQYINYAFPDPLEYYYVEPYSGGIRFAMASLIVLVPLALVLMRFLRSDMVAVPEKKELWVRRWALVLTVFIAGAVVVGDLITLINYFLGGDLTTRFLLKVLVVLGIAGAVFLHFLADIRGYWAENPSRAKMVGYAAGLLVLLSIIAGFFIMGSPAQVRLYRFDDQKVSDLQNIQWQIVNFWQEKQALPKSLADLEDPISGFIAPKDPQTGEMYSYETGPGLSFTLCATFNAESQGPARSSPYYNEFLGDVKGNDNWQHGAGEHCFERSIDPDRYPPYNKDIQQPVPAVIR